METRLSGQYIALEPSDDDDDGYAPIAYLRDCAAAPLQQIEAAQDEGLRTAGLELALSRLDDRSRRIIEARWLREKDQNRCPAA